MPVNNLSFNCYIATHTQSLDIGNYVSRIPKKIIVKLVLYNTRILYKCNAVQSSNFKRWVTLVDFIEISKLIELRNICFWIINLRVNSKFQKCWFIRAKRRESYFASETNYEYSLTRLLHWNPCLNNLEYIIILFCCVKL